MSKLPFAVRQWAVKVLGRKADILTLHVSREKEPSLRLWIQKEFPSNSRSSADSETMYVVCAADKWGFISGHAEFMGWDFPVDLRVFPRREKFLFVKLLKTEDSQHFTEVGSFRIKNPVVQKYPVWAPDPEHTVRTNGHLRVELKRLLTGTSGKLTYTKLPTGDEMVQLQPNQPSAPNYSVVQTKISTGDQNYERWEVCGVVVSDATGNTIQGSRLSTGGDHTATSFTPGLWPSEPAWKLRLELKRWAGFGTHEVCAVDLPLPQLGETNLLGWSTNVNGCRITVSEVCRRAAGTEDSWKSLSSSFVKMTHSRLPQDFHLDLTQVWFDAERANSVRWNSGSQERYYWLPTTPENCKTVRLLFAVHQSRTVEFKAKPVLCAPE